MKLQGTEHIRFAPGMMKPNTDTFFCYAFVFELKQDPVLTESVIQDEFLAYYRGLCKAVLRGNPAEVDPADFTLKLRKVKPENDTPEAIDRYTGVLNWVEPFATKKPQTLYLTIRVWSTDTNNYLFACVSPQKPNAPIWKQLHAIRDDYLKKQGE